MKPSAPQNKSSPSESRDAPCPAADLLGWRWWVAFTCQGGWWCHYNICFLLMMPLQHMFSISNSSSSATHTTVMLSQNGTKAYAPLPEYRENTRFSNKGLKHFRSVTQWFFFFIFAKRSLNRSMGFLLLITSIHNLVTPPVPLEDSMVMWNSTCTQTPSTITFQQNQIKLDWLKIKVLPGNIILSVYLWETPLRVLLKEVKSILAASIFMKLM